MDNKFLMWYVLGSFSNNYYGVISHRNKRNKIVNLTHFGLENPILSYLDLDQNALILWTVHFWIFGSSTFADCPSKSLPKTLSTSPFLYVMVQFVPYGPSSLAPRRSAAHFGPVLVWESYWEFFQFWRTKSSFDISWSLFDYHINSYVRIWSWSCSRIPAQNPPPNHFFWPIKFVVK